MDGQREEFYVLLLLATLGSAVLAASTHFASFFLGLEILSVSLYALIAYLRRRPDERRGRAQVPGPGRRLLGVPALRHGPGLRASWAPWSSPAWPVAAADAGRDSVLLLAGLAMMLVGRRLQAGAWCRSTSGRRTSTRARRAGDRLRRHGLQGRPCSPCCCATSPAGRPPAQRSFYPGGAAIIAIASMLVGNLLALLQNNVKRILAYSSIAHLGYLLVAFLAGGRPAVPAAVAFYLAAYFVTTLGALRRGDRALRRAIATPTCIDDYRGLFWRRPWLAAGFTAMLLSLAGIPLTAGFIGKFYVLAAGVGRPVAAGDRLVIGSGIGLYYYLRLASAMYAQPVDQVVKPPVSFSSVASALLVALVVLLFLFGTFPSPLIDLIQGTVGRLS